jgi:hypothetical protein
MQFLFTAFESLEKIAISFKQLGPLGREWLAALVILYTIDHYDSKGWNELEEWLTGFVQKLKNTKPKFIIMGDPDHPI